MSGGIGRGLTNGVDRASPALLAKSPRLRSIAAMQLICIGLIVARHYSHYLHAAMPDAMTMVGRIDFCEFFFVSSGYLIHRGARTGGFAFLPFMRRRLSRLYPLHLATTAFFVVAVLAGTRGSLNGETLGRCAAANALMLQATGVLNAVCLNYPAWFLGAIMFMYLAYPLLARLVEAAPGAAIAIVGAIVLALTVASSGGASWTVWTHHFGIARALPSFLGGMIMARLEIERRLPIRGFGAAWLLLALSLATMASGAAPVIGNFVLQNALLAVLAAAEWNGAQGLLTGPRLARWAPAAFPLFLLHAPIAAAIVNIGALRILHLTGAALAGATVAAAILALLAARLFVTMTSTRAAPARAAAVLEPAR